MSTPNVSVFMLERLKAWGVGRVYGYPGDGTNGLNLAFHEVGEEIEFVQVRHEELASFAACAHAKLTGEVGVCMATSGPGAIHLLNGLYDAKLDNAPVVAIVGQQKRMSLGGDFQQEVDLRSLFGDVAGEYVGECNDPRQAAHLIDRAMRIARSQRTVTAVIVPSDVQEMATRSRRAHTAPCTRASPASTIRSSAPATTSCAGPRRCSTRARAWRCSSASAPPTRSSRSPRCSAPASPRRSTGAPWCPTTCRSSPARSACSAPSHPP